MQGHLLPSLIQSIEERRAVALVTLVSLRGHVPCKVGAQCLVWLEGEAQGNLKLNPAGMARVRAVLRARTPRKILIPCGEAELECFVEVHRKPPHLLIVGAGHIAVPLAVLGTLCDFSVTVLDDRPQYANTRRFPQADSVLAADFLPALRQLRSEHQLDDQTCVVLVTRGHQYDVDCLAELLDDDLPYLGMIGSKRRIRAVFELLQSERGLRKAQFANVYAPIGLDIGAQTPAEIAVCIMAEIINVMQSGKMPSLRDAR